MMARETTAPSVSFIIPVYNASAYLERALDSVSGQSMRDWELVIVDDCSTDGSDEIIRRYAERDPRIRVRFRPTNSGGAFVPRREAAEMARTSLIAPLDADDWIGPDYLANLYNRLGETASDIVFPTMHVCDPVRPFTIPASGPLQSMTGTGRDMVRLTLGDWLISANGGLIRRDLYLDCIALVKRHSFIYADEFLTRVLLVNAPRVTISPEPYYFRPNDNSVTHRVSSRMFDLLTGDALLAEYVSSEFPEGSEERIKMEFQRFFNIVGALRRYNEVGSRLTAFGRRKVRIMLKRAYAGIDWNLLRRTAGWKYPLLMRAGLRPAATFLKIYDSLRGK